MPPCTSSTWADRWHPGEAGARRRRAACLLPAAAAGGAAFPDSPPRPRRPAQFAPTREGFLRFMVESKVVYDTFEDIMHQAPVEYCEQGGGG